MAELGPKRCLGCGYILDGLPEPRCPERGRGFDPSDSMRCQVAQRASKQEGEELLVTEFLAHLHIEVLAVTMLVPPKPDAKVRCVLDAVERTVFVELTQYQVDQKGQRGSAARRAADTERKILDCAQQLCAQHGVPGWELELWASFDPENVVPKGDRGAVADDLALFLEANIARIGPEFAEFSRNSDDFGSFPRLQAHVRHMHVKKEVGTARGHRRWQRSDAREIGIVPSLIAALIAKKADKRRSYDLQNDAECWLLICASGTTSADRAGPLVAGDGALLAAQYGVEARQAGFDRIYFWERVCGWSHQLWPSEPQERGNILFF